MLKLKGFGRRKLLVIGGLSLVLGGAGAGIWFFLPGFNPLNSMLALVGLAKPESEVGKSAVAPSSQAEGQGKGVATGETEFFSSQSDLVVAVRTMLGRQTELAMGMPGSGARLKESMGVIALMSTKLDVRALSTQEYDAAAIYVLSGGRPEILGRIAAEVKLDPERKKLFEGAVSFVTGDLKTAAEKLATINPVMFEPVLAARVYMLQAHLQDKAPYETRRHLLQKAANITFGTLFEEAAIRRLVALAGDGAMFADFNYWADRYQRRFPYSPYFPDFWADVLKTVFAAEGRDDKFALPDLHRLILHLPDDRRLDLLRSLISRAIREGRPRLCQFGLEEAADSSGRSGEMVEKLRLYKLACNVGTAPEEVAPQLALLDRNKLDANDLALLQSANLLTQGVLAKPSGPPQEKQVYGPQPGYPGVDLVRARSASVAQQLDVTNSLLKRAEK